MLSVLLFEKMINQFPLKKKTWISKGFSYFNNLLKFLFIINKTIPLDQYMNKKNTRVEDEEHSWAHAICVKILEDYFFLGKSLI